MLQELIPASKVSYATLPPLIRYILFTIGDETGRRQVYAYDNTAKDRATKAEITKKKNPPQL